MVFRMPEVNFDWLANLPSVAEDTRLRFGRQEALADLDSSDPESLRAAAVKLSKLGGLKELEMSARLHKTALEREQLSQKAKYEDAYLKAVGPIYEKLNLGKPGAPGAGVPGGPQDDGTVIQPSQARPPAPGSPPWGGPQGDLPDPSGGLPPGMPVVPPQAPPGSSAELIDRAAGGGPVAPPRGPQTAQAGGPIQLPMIDVQPNQPAAPPPPAPPPSIGQLPSWMQGTSVMPQGAPTGGPVPTRGPVPDLPALSPELQRELNSVSQISAELGPRASPSQRQLVAERLKAVIAKTGWTPEVKGWHAVRMDNWARGEPDIGLQEYQDQQKTLDSRFKEAIDVTKPYRDDAMKAEKLQGQVKTLQSIMRNPQFISGEYAAPIVQRVGSMLSGLKGTLVAFGLAKEEDLPIFDKFTKPAALLEAFQAMSNQAVIATLGGLGNQISNPDRDYVNASFPNLKFTKQGNELLLEIMDAVSKRNIDIGKAVSSYRAHAKSQATAEGVDMVVRKYADDNRIWINKDGTPTGFAKRVSGEVEKAAPTPPPQSTPAAPAAPKQYLPGEIFYKGGQPFTYDENYKIIPAPSGGSQL